MRCERCEGLLVAEWISRGWLWRCVNCGDRTDQAILRNRAEQEAVVVGQREAEARTLKEWQEWLEKVPVVHV